VILKGKGIISTITFIRNANVAPHAIADLREAVGWERHDEDYPAAFMGYWATVSGFDTTSTNIDGEMPSMPGERSDATSVAARFIAPKGWGGATSPAVSATPVAWCAILSDGVRHAVLIDVIVHPGWQRRGVGQALVAEAVEHIRAHGISIIHVDYLPEHATFYEKCGFQTGLGGIYTG
jgi:GNAT superfamily N-acetyltransferase